MGSSASPEKGKTSKFSITTPVYLRHEIEDLIGVYGPSRSEVVNVILQAWFHDNREKADLRKSQYEAYRASRSKQTRRR